MNTFYFVSLGCPKNRVDTEVAAASLIAAGFRPVQSPEEADLIVVNTCSFLTSAKEESIETLLEMAQWKVEGRAQKLVAMGCLGQEVADDLAASMPELDLVLGTGDVNALPALLRDGPRVHRSTPTFLPDYAAKRVLTLSPAFAYVKVADGCSRKCAFCTIPSIKGPFASRPIGAVVDEARELVDAGVKEIVLVAQDLTQFGKPGRRRLINLLDALEKVDRLEWIRLMYLYPEGLTDALLRRIEEGGKVLPYLDMPVQHADDRVLRRMRRSTSRSSIERVLSRVRSASRHIAIRTTVIVGHPGEDERSFDSLLDFVREHRLENLGVFAFSPEPGTHAAQQPDQVPPEVAADRVDQVMALQQGISRSANEALIDSRTTVLVEGPSQEHEWVQYGRTKYQAPEVDGIVYLDGYDGPAGALIDTVVTDATDYDLVAKEVE